MTSPLLNSSIDALTWLLLKAGSDRQEMKQAKLHGLLYLAQGYYAAATDGDKFIPSIFVAGAKGPIEPNLLKACRYFNKPPTIYELPEQAVMFLESIWRKYGGTAESDLSEMLRNESPYLKARGIGANSEISFDDMLRYYRAKAQITQKSGKTAGEVAKDAKPVIMRNEEGRPVRVTSWQPRRHKE